MKFVLFIQEFEQASKSNEENLRQLNASYENIEDQLVGNLKQDISDKIKEETIRYQRIRDEYKGNLIFA